MSYSNVLTALLSIVSSVGVVVAMQNANRNKELEVESLVMKGDSGQVVLRIGRKLESKAPGIYLYNDQGQTVLELAVHSGKWPELKMGDGNHPKMTAQLAHNNDATLAFLSTDKDGGGWLPVAQIGAGTPCYWPSQPEPALSDGFIQIRDKNGNIIKK